MEVYNEIIRMQLQNASADLTPTSTGLIYFNTTSSIAKIYTGSAWKTFLWADFSNVTGTLAIANGGTGQTSATAAFDALAPTTTSGDTIYHNGTDNVRLPIGANGQVLGVSSGLPAWQDAASGGSGVNYIENDDFESSVSPWATYADAAAATPVDGTGGSPTVTFTRNTTTPLRGNADGKFSKDAANRQGQGFSVDMTVPKGYVYGQKSQIRFLWDGSHANYVAGDMVVYIYDVTNSTLITPTATSLPKAKQVISIAFDQSGTGASYRLIFHVATTNASAYDIYVDDVLTGPGFPGQGAVVGEWTTFTPTGSWSTNTTYTGRYRRVGDSMELNYRISLAGAPTAANLTLNMPSGFTVNSSSMVVVSVLGSVVIFDNSTDDNYIGLVRYNGSNFTVLHNASTSNDGVINASTPITFAVDDSITVRLTVPVAEWAGSGTFVGQNNVEYASNSDNSSTASNTSSFAYGPSGSQIPNGATGTNYVRRVKFQTPIQSTDQITLQIYNVSQWSDTDESALLVSRFGYAGGLNYGMSWAPVSSTEIDVSFYNGGRYPGTVINTAGDAWSTISSSSYAWRVVKKSGGQAVGFGLATSTQSGLVNKSRYQKKAVTSNVTTPSSGTLLTFNNLVVGNTYRAFAQSWIENGVSDDSVRLFIEHNSSSISEINLGGAPTSDNVSVTMATEVIFVAAATTVLLKYSSLDSTAVIVGNAGGTYTFMTLEELGDYEVTTAFT